VIVRAGAIASASYGEKKWRWALYRSVSLPLHITCCCKVFTFHLYPTL
jgi:hypothetical protein